jgi:hypothetical protein
LQLTGRKQFFRKAKAELEKSEGDCAVIKVNNKSLLLISHQVAGTATRFLNDEERFIHPFDL